MKPIVPCRQQRRSLALRLAKAAIFDKYATVALSGNLYWPDGFPRKVRRAATRKLAKRMMA